MPSFDECGISPICWTKGWAGDGLAAAGVAVMNSVANALGDAMQFGVRIMGEMILGFNPLGDTLADDGTIVKNVAMNSLLQSISDAVLGNQTTVTPSNPYFASMEWLQTKMVSVQMILVFVSIVVAGALMAWHQRGEPLRDLLKSVMTVIAVSGVSIEGVRLLVGAGDAWASWMMSSVGNGISLVDNLLAAGQTGLSGGVMMTIFLFLFGLIGGLIQCVLLFVRTPLLILLVGLWPLSASATNLSWGKQWFDKTTGWIAAFICFKPAVAIIFALGQALMSASSTSAWADFWSVLYGITLIGLSILALPALVKFVVPAVGAMSSGGGAASGAMAAAGVAAGARIMSRAGGAASGAAGGAGTPSGGGGASSDGESSGGGDSTADGASTSPSGSSSGASPSGGGKHSASGGGSDSAGTDGAADSTAGGADPSTGPGGATGTQTASGASASGGAAGEGASTGSGASAGEAGTEGGAAAVGGAGTGGGAAGGAAAAGAAGVAGLAVAGGVQAVRGAVNMAQSTASEAVAEGGEPYGG